MLMRAADPLRFPKIVAPLVAGGLAVGLVFMMVVLWGAVSGSNRVTRVQPPGYERLSASEKLDRALTLPGFQGALLGTVGQPYVTFLPAPGFPLGRAVTEFPFLVAGFYGPGAPPYAAGSTITLRVPGGSLGGATFAVEDAPTVAAGEELFVGVRDQGTYWGGNSPDIVVASSTADVFRVVNGIVEGQGLFAGFSEPVSRYESHFMPRPGDPLRVRWTQLRG